MVAQSSDNRNNISFDWVLIALFCTLVFIGLANIYAATFASQGLDEFNFNQSAVKQMMWIATSFMLAIFILQIDSKFFSLFSYGIFAFMIFLLLLVLVFGKEVNGARSWFQLGPIRLQPAEFAKFATSLAVAKYLSTYNVYANRLKTLFIVGAILFLPFALIIKQNDTGSALVYSSFFLVLYREGMTGAVLLTGVLAVVLFISVLLAGILPVLFAVIGLGILLYLLFFRNTKETLIGVTVEVFLVILNWYYSNAYPDFFDKYLYTDTVVQILVALVGIVSVVALVHAFRKRLKSLLYLVLFIFGAIAFSFSVDYAFNKVLSEHQRTRIEVLLGLTIDQRGVGYNVHQSKIAIGAGGFYGKGFLQGTRNKGEFVPEQSTDFIFCTVGEEWGFAGSTATIALFILFLWRVLFLAERQRSPFSRIYGYSVAAILFFHFTINIGMTIGLVPVIGIPLPFFSYGGSSLWSFTILVFIFIKLDSSRDEIL